jgi:RNA polymerase sigma-70 factor, ECF subfamily
VSRSEQADIVALFEEERARLCRYLFRFTGDADVAADAAQEAFVRALGRPLDAKGVRAWLYRVATNIALDTGRTHARRRELLRESALRTPHADEPPLPDEHALLAREQLRVRSALSMLKPSERAILIMRSEGFTHREIAETVGTTTGSVGTLTARAARKFKRYLQGVEVIP